MCYRPSTRKMFISRDVVIDKDNLFNPTPKPETQSDPPVNNTPAPIRTEESQTLPNLHTQQPILDTHDNSQSPHQTSILSDMSQLSSPTLSGANTPQTVPGKNHFSDLLTTSRNQSPLTVQPHQTLLMPSPRFCSSCRA